MRISEAIVVAKPHQFGIYRDSWKGIIAVYPTDTCDGCIITSTLRSPCPRWNPCQDDLIADDWNVKEVSMSEALSAFGIGRCQP